MPRRRRSCWPVRNSLAALALLATILLLPACADDRALIDQTLDARERALNTKNLEAYFQLFSPEYVWAQPMSEYREVMRKRFANYLAIEYQAYSRTVDINGDTARVIQEYRFTLTDRYHQTQTINGTDHFLLKQQGSWPFKKWLFYQGLDVAPKPAATPAAAPAAASPAPATPATGGNP